MAIFWNHLKGTNSSNLYSWISWTEKSDFPGTYTFEYAPEIKIYSENDLSRAESLGHILTSGIDHTLLTSWTWSSAEDSYIELYGANVSSTNCSWTHTKNFMFNLLSEASIMIQSKKDSQTEPKSLIQIKTKDAEGQPKDSLTINCETTINNTTTMNAALFAKSYIEADGYCKAQYFSAVSDRRAKRNIQSCHFNALECVNSVPTYTFNYYNQTKPSLGIMAQDIKTPELQELLIDNLEASGQDNDYMSIRESKLVYILWKAIQEQQDIIQKLTERIIRLEGGKVHE